MLPRRGVFCWECGVRHTLGQIAILVLETHKLICNVMHMDINLYTVMKGENSQIGSEINKNAI